MVSQSPLCESEDAMPSYPDAVGVREVIPPNDVVASSRRRAIAELAALVLSCESTPESFARRSREGCE
jgi:hypothetical protein